MYGVRAVQLLGCPETLPTDWVCVASSTGAGTYLAGPGADLSGADLAGQDFTDTNLEDANLAGANLSNTTFTGASLAGADFSEATLSGAYGVDLNGCPSELATGWDCLTDSTSGRDFLLGPGVDLTGLDLTGTDLSLVSLDGSDLTIATFKSLASCPLALPTSWVCLATGASGKVLVGPGAVLTSVNLSSADLAGVDLTGANLTNAVLSAAILTNATFEAATVTNVTWSAATVCPDGTDGNGSCCGHFAGATVAAGCD